MESSRRSFDRSRELGVKKPRIEEPNPNGHGRPLQKAVTPATGPTARYRSADRDSDSNDSSRGGAYHPQPQQQQYQELVTQYKTALAELTFNSKPIITNLTIIAGENLLAAKAIAATICANILEVPSEQKLPSLYLLDSIVKNIGRDYIKYFAARLPEVFIKAYRHSDPPVHQSMRHLFGTWKGVFPPQTLQMIGKELGFTPLVNGSSTGAASRSDSQSQRPPHSIHVNPKYLERQRLQQSSTAKGMPSDIAGAIAGSTEEMDKSDRASTVTSRPWADPRIKMQNINRSHKDELSDSVHEKNIISAPYEDFEYSSDLSRPSGMGIGKTGGRVIEQGLDKSLYGSGSSASGTISGQRNGLNAKHGLPSYSSLKNANVDSHPKPDQSIVSRTSSGMSSSWKNSEEEEFMWEMHSRVADHDIASLSMNSRKDHRAPHVSKKLGYESHLRKPNSLHDVVSKFERENSADSLPNEQKEQATCGQQTVSPWRSQESHSVDGLISSGISSHSQGYSTSFGGLPTNSSSLSRVGDQQQMGSSRIGASGFGFHGTLPQPRFQPLGGASPSGHSPVRQHPPSPPFSARHGRHQLKNITEQDHQLLQPLPRPDFRTSQFSGQLSGYHSTKEPSTVLASDILRGNLQKSQLQLRDFQSSSPSDQTQRPPSTIVNSAPENSDPLAAGTSGQLSTSSLLAEVMKSGIFSNNTINVKTPNRGSLDTVQVLSKPTIQPPLPRAPTLALAATDISETRVEQTPLSLSPAPSLSQTSDAVSKTPDPISNLLSSLVAKGLISASETETSTTMSSQTPSQLKGVDSITATPISTPVTFVPTSLGGSRLSIMDETSVSEPTGNSSDSLPQSSKIWAKNIVGLKFKPDLIREMHPDVINGLFDDLPHCCTICGLRLRLREQLDRHLVWHASLKAPEPGGLSRASRGWYSNAEDWIYGRAGLPLVSDFAVPVEESEEGTDGNAAMVPADEDRCVCVLCGGLFEDFFCQERNGWMFKGAVYLTRPLGDGEMETAHEGDVNVPIVHADCMSREFSS